MKLRIQKSMIALMLCLALAVTSSVTTIRAEASGISDNGQTKIEENTGADQGNVKEPESNPITPNPGNEEDANLNEEEKHESLENEAESENEEENQNDAEEQKMVGVEYQAHVQTYGWQNPVKDGELAGTSGQSKRVEAIKMSLVNLPEEYEGSSIEYAVHVQTYGWQNPVTDGAMAGTSGQAKRLEAITVKLNGTIANDYDVYYRTHVQTYGWLGWAENGERAGSATASKRMEAIEIKLVKHGEEAPESTGVAYRCPLIGYRTHMQSYGWRSMAYDDSIGGVTGQSKRMEAIKIT